MNHNEGVKTNCVKDSMFFHAQLHCFGFYVYEAGIIAFNFW
jgi:hypothetical protein